MFLFRVEASDIIYSSGQIIEATGKYIKIFKCDK